MTKHTPNVAAALRAIDRMLELVNRTESDMEGGLSTQGPRAQLHLDRQGLEDARSLLAEGKAEMNTEEVRTPVNRQKLLDIAEWVAQQDCECDETKPPCCPCEARALLAKLEN